MADVARGGEALARISTGQHDEGASIRTQSSSLLKLARLAYGIDKCHD